MPQVHFLRLSITHNKVKRNVHPLAHPNYTVSKFC